MQKKVIYSGGVLLVLVCVLVGARSYIKNIEPSNMDPSADASMVKASEGQYVTDFNDDRRLLGASHNVFVAKIIDAGDSIPGQFGMSAQLKVAIIENIK